MSRPVVSLAVIAVVLGSAPPALQLVEDGVEVAMLEVLCSSDLVAVMSSMDHQAARWQVSSRSLSSAQAVPQPSRPSYRRPLPPPHAEVALLSALKLSVAWSLIAAIQHRNWPTVSILQRSQPRQVNWAMDRELGVRKRQTYRC